MPDPWSPGTQSQPIPLQAALEHDTYEQLQARRLAAGASPVDAAVAATEAYLDDQPETRGKRRTTAAERDAAFWSSAFLLTLPAEAWLLEPMALALARYMSQERLGRIELVEWIATLAPEALRRAVRHSGLVLRPHSLHRAEIEELGSKSPQEFRDIAHVLEMFDAAHEQGLADLERLKAPLAELSPLELLTYASLHAFEHLVPADLDTAGAVPDEPDERIERSWAAINDLMAWKLSTSDEGALYATEASLGRWLAIHVSPFLFPSARGSPPRQDWRDAFDALLAAQVELNAFVSDSADAFSHDDAIHFIVQDGALEIVERDPRARNRRETDARRQSLLRGYWERRARAVVAAWEPPAAGGDRALPDDAQARAWLRATRTRLLLTEVHGLEESLTTDTGQSVHLLRALVMLELMAAFFRAEFLSPFVRYRAATGQWQSALGRVAFDGLRQPGSPNRLPITWSDRPQKLVEIAGWLAGKESPASHAHAAEALLDLWTEDWMPLAGRLRRGERGFHPELFGRPILKMGRHLFQLPWMAGQQDHTARAVSNLSLTGQAGLGLVALFEQRGFRVVRRHHTEITQDADSGEADFICALDGIVLVLELRPAPQRTSLRQAWLHRTRTLREAGLRLRARFESVIAGLASNPALQAALDLGGQQATPVVHGWVVDTSAAFDGERIAGFLKVSVEALLIALRDDRHLLYGDPAATVGSLYAQGFGAARLVEVIESGAVWRTG